MTRRHSWAAMAVSLTAFAVWSLQGSAFAVPRMLRNGRRAMVMQVDVYGDGEGDEQLLATATVNFAVINGATPKLPDWPPA